jgi:hypothetical protein
MEALRVTHEEILRLSKIASMSDIEINKNHLSIRNILIIRRNYARQFCYIDMKNKIPEQVLDLAIKGVEHCDNQIKLFYGIK